MTLVFISVSWIAGIYLATQTDLPWQSAALSLPASVLLALLLRGRAVTVVPAVALALLSLGAFRVGWPPETTDPLPIRAYNGAGATVVEGVVSSDPEPRGTGYRFALSVERVDAGEGWQDSRGLLRVVAVPSPSLVSTRSDRLFRYGDRLVLTGRVEEPPVLQGFDYRDYLAREGIFSTMTYPQVELAGEGGGSALLRGIYAFRHRLSRSLSLAVAEPQASLGQALLLGQRSTIPPELTQAFRDTGTSHLLAISGLHVGVLLGLSLAFARWLLGARRHLYLLLPLLSIWAYASLAGMSPSAERAAIMGSIYLAGLYLGRPRSVMPALAAAAALMVGLEPRVLTQVSFQLSFTAMTGLALLAPPLERWLQAVLRTDAEGFGWARALAYGIAATVAATVATLPLVAFYFHQIPLLGLPGTLLALPALPVTLGASLITALLGLFSPGAAEVAGWAVWLLLSYLKAIVELIDAVPGGVLRTESLGAPLVVLYYGTLIAWIAGRSRFKVAIRVAPDPLRRAWAGMGGAGPWLPQGRAYLALLALALMAAMVVWSAALSRPDGRLHVTLLDIGQGDGALIITPSGRQVLIDGGPDPQRLMSQLGRRVPFWDHSLDLVVLTHAHRDHVAGLVEVLRRYDVGLVLERTTDSSSPEYAMWRASLAEGDVPVVQAIAGQRIELDDGLVLEVLNPPERLVEGTSSDLDNSSVVVRLVYGEASFLFTGDLYWDGESSLMHSSPPIGSTVLKVGHHGSRHSTSEEFLKEVSPQVAVISAGEANRFGHPHEETLEILGGLLPPGRILVTSEVGSVELTSDGSRLWLRTER